MSFDATTFSALTKPALIELCKPYGLVDRTTHRNKSELISRISTLDEGSLTVLTAAATDPATRKQKRPDKTGVSASRKKGKYIAATVDEEQVWDRMQAFAAPCPDVVSRCISRFINGLATKPWRLQYVSLAPANWLGRKQPALLSVTCQIHTCSSLPSRTQRMIYSMECWSTGLRCNRMVKGEYALTASHASSGTSARASHCLMGCGSGKCHWNCHLSRCQSRYWWQGITQQLML